MMGAKVRGQLGMDETRVDDEELEKALEVRYSRQRSAADARVAFAEQDKLVKGKIAELDLPPDAVIRCGRFRIVTEAIAAHDVAFTTEASKRIRISAEGEE